MGTMFTTSASYLSTATNVSEDRVGKHNFLCSQNPEQNNEIIIVADL